VFVACGGVVDRPVEELAERAEEFEFSVNAFHRAMHAFADKEIEQVLLGKHEGPRQVNERNTLRGAAFAERGKRFLDFAFSFCEQPIAEMALDVVTALMQFCGRDLEQAAGALGRKQTVG